MRQCHLCAILDIYLKSKVKDDNLMKHFKKAVALLVALAMCGCSSQTAAPEPTADGTEPTATEENVGTEAAEETDYTGEMFGFGMMMDGEGEPDGNDSSGNFTGTADTGELSAYTTQYTGRAGTGDFNYGEALQKSLIFYELQRSGDLPADIRTNWRGDSGMNDGADNGVDLTGGLYDAGDNVKFNLPMAYTSAMLAWSVYEDKDAYEESGQLNYALGTIKWVNDYLIKCHTDKYEFYYQVGDGNADHSWWGASEAMTMDRPSFKVTLDSPGSAVTAEAAASLAACAVVFKDIDAAYSEKCLSHAKELYEFAEKANSDSGYTAANGFYTSWSGWYDELAWAASWLYTATGDSSWLDKAKVAFNKADSNTRWTMCWDNVSMGAALRLAMITEDSVYHNKIRENLDYWLNGITYTPDGLAWLDSWGSLRYASTEAFLAAVYSESSICPDSERNKYWDFAVSQINYALGSTGQSFVCGYGDNCPQHPHHRTSQGSYCNNMNEPSTARHILFGALVGGPDSSGRYEDSVSNYTLNEVACDYNAGFTGALAKLYTRYGGETLVNFGAVETVPENEELFIEAGVNASGDNFTEIKAVVYNHTAWPARITDKLVMRYFFNISELIDAGGSVSDLSVNGNYMQGGSLGTIKPWDEANGIYCLDIDFTGEKIGPSSQDNCKREVQFRISSSSAWNPNNDFSYSGLGSQQGSVSLAASIALYDDGVLVFGSEPSNGAQTPVEGENADYPEATTTQSQSVSAGGTAEENGLRVTIASVEGNNSANVNIGIEITNTSDSAIDLSDLEVRYYLTKDGADGLTFFCDHSAVQTASDYVMLKSVSGDFESASGTKTDTVCKITCSDSITLNKNETWKIQGRICKDDWTAIDGSNDYSAKNGIAVYSNGKLIYGQEP